MLMMWLYFSGLVLLGGELNAALESKNSTRRNPRGVKSTQDSPSKMTPKSYLLKKFKNGIPPKP